MAGVDDGEPRIPRCPSEAHFLAAPSTCLLCAAVAVCALVFGLVAIRLSSVRLPGRSGRVRLKAKSPAHHILWLCYFLSVFVRSSVTAVRYGLRNETGEEDLGFEATSITVAGSSALFLSLALNQLRMNEDAFEVVCNSPLSPKIMEGIEYRSLGVAQPKQWCQRVFGKHVLEAGLVALFLLYQLAAGLHIAHLDDGLLKWLWVGTTVLQRVPQFVFGLMIACGTPVVSSLQTRMPRANKTMILIAVFINLPEDLEIEEWNSLLSKYGCVVRIGSAVDIILLLYILALLFFFLFLVQEHRRHVGSVTTMNLNSIQRFDSEDDFEGADDDDSSAGGVGGGGGLTSPRRLLDR